MPKRLQAFCNFHDSLMMGDVNAVSDPDNAIECDECFLMFLNVSHSGQPPEVWHCCSDEELARCEG